VRACVRACVCMCMHVVRERVHLQAHELGFAGDRERRIVPHELGKRLAVVHRHAAVRRRPLLRPAARERTKSGSRCGPRRPPQLRIALTYTPAHPHTPAHIHPHTRTHARTHTHTHTHTHARTHAYARTHTAQAHIRAHARTHARTARVERNGRSSSPVSRLVLCVLPHCGYSEYFHGYAPQAQLALEPLLDAQLALNLVVRRDQLVLCMLECVASLRHTIQLNPIRSRAQRSRPCAAGAGARPLRTGAGGGRSLYSWGSGFGRRGNR
jgi:hypothetical protein